MLIGGFMNIIFKLISIFVFVLITFNVFAIDKTTSVQDAITIIQDRVESDHYKLDLLEDNVKLQYLKTWPLEIVDGLKTALLADEYAISDDEQLGALIDYVDPSGEYSVSGKIIRSVTVSLDQATLYVAIYSVFGGEWARESEYKLIYIFDSKGTLLFKDQIEK